MHLSCFFTVRQNKGVTPVASHHPSRPSFDASSDFFAATVEPAPRDHKTAKHTALKRDDYKCMVTEQPGCGFAAATTNFYHIFPPSTNWSLELTANNHPKTTYAGHMWNFVYAFGGIQVLDELNGDEIHRLSNGLTLKVDLHTECDNLNMWFEEAQNNPPNTCSIFAPGPGVPTTPITFVSSSPELELPNPRYLKLSVVAHMSGAAE